MRAIIVSLLIAGCGGLSVEQDPPATESARTYFDLNVAPLLAQKCNACHQYTYDSIVADPGLTGNFDPNAAQIMMQTPSFGGIHPGGDAGWTPAAQTIIATWLEAEAEARGL